MANEQKNAVIVVDENTIHEIFTRWYEGWNKCDLTTAKARIQRRARKSARANGKEAMEYFLRLYDEVVSKEAPTISVADPLTRVPIIQSEACPPDQVAMIRKDEATGKISTGLIVHIGLPGAEDEKRVELGPLAERYTK